MNNAFETSLRTLIGFTLLLILTRLLGKKQLGQLTIFTYITGVSLGNVAGDMIVHRDIQIMDGVIALTLWSFLTFIVEFISLKSPKGRIFLDGEPTIVIKKGVIMQKELAKHRLNMDDLTMLLRVNNVFYIQDVDYAILEPNGQLSILKKSSLESITKKDMQIQTHNRNNLPTEIIVDGKLVSKNLSELNLTHEWLNNQLKQAGIKSIKDVFYAELQSDKSLYLSQKVKS